MAWEDIFKFELHHIFPEDLSPRLKDELRNIGIYVDSVGNLKPTWGTQGTASIASVGCAFMRTLAKPIMTARTADYRGDMMNMANPVDHQLTRV